MSEAVKKYEYDGQELYPQGDEKDAPFNRLKARLERGVVDGEIPPTVDVPALARFVQAVQNGMSILARDGVSRAELESVAQGAMLGWDARVR